MPNKTTKKIERDALETVKGAINMEDGRFEQLPVWAQDELLAMQNLIWTLIRMLEEK